MDPLQPKAQHVQDLLQGSWRGSSVGSVRMVFAEGDFAEEVVAEEVE